MSPTRWAVAPTVAWVDQGDEGVTLLDLRDPNTAVPFKTQGAGAFLWRLISDGCVTSAECAEALREATGRDRAEVEQEAATFLDALHRAGLTEGRDA